jgi:hypothetical protein
MQNNPPNITQTSRCKKSGKTTSLYCKATLYNAMGDKYTWDQSIYIQNPQMKPQREEKKKNPKISRFVGSDWWRIQPRIIHLTAPMCFLASFHSKNAIGWIGALKYPTILEKMISNSFIAFSADTASPGD